MKIKLPEKPKPMILGSRRRDGITQLADPFIYGFNSDQMDDHATAAVELNRPTVDGWRPIETAPEGQLVVVGWNECDGGPPACLEFDCKEDGLWMNHEANVEHADAAAPAGSSVPSREAPYKWWLPIPQLPNTSALGEQE